MEVILARRHINAKYSQIDEAGRHHKSRQKWDKVQKDQLMPWGNRQSKGVLTVPMAGCGPEVLISLILRKKPYDTLLSQDIC